MLVIGLGFGLEGGAAAVAGWIGGGGFGLEKCSEVGRGFGRGFRGGLWRGVQGGEL